MTVRGWVVLAALALFMAPASARFVRVVDGDTIELPDGVHRIHGIDAPEAGQRCARAGGGAWPCGREAIAVLERLVAAGTVSCDDRGRDGYGRILSVCTAAGRDLGGALVDLGLAWSFRRYAHDYDGAEDAAHAAGRGIWQAETETPWDYRAKAWTAAAETVPDGCPIKGNVNAKGERIYHPPWSPWWSRTRVDRRRGERWFCDEAAAVAAGFRAPYWGR